MASHHQIGSNSQGGDAFLLRISRAGKLPPFIVGKTIRQISDDFRRYWKDTHLSQLLGVCHRQRSASINHHVNFSGEQTTHRIHDRHMPRPIIHIWPQPDLPQQIKSVAHTAGLGGAERNHSVSEIPKNTDVTILADNDLNIFRKQRHGGSKTLKDLVAVFPFIGVVGNIILHDCHIQ